MRNRFFDFSNKMRVFRVITAHLTAMFAVLLIVCFIFDRVNTAMEFMSSELSKWCIAILAVLALISSILTICALWINPDKKRRPAPQRRRR